MNINVFDMMKLESTKPELCSVSLLKFNNLIAWHRGYQLLTRECSEVSKSIIDSP